MKNIFLLVAIVFAGGCASTPQQGKQGSRIPASSGVYRFDGSSIDKYIPCIKAIEAADQKTGHVLGLVAGRGYLVVGQYGFVEVYSDAGKMTVGTTEKGLAIAELDETQNLNTGIAVLISKLVRGNYGAYDDGGFTVSPEHAKIVRPVVKECQTLGGAAQAASINAAKHFP